MELTIKQINGIPEYYCDSDGIFYTTKVSPRYNPNGVMRVLQPRTHPSGYLYCGFFVGKGPNKRRIWKRAHRVVYETFVGKIKQGLEIDHIDGDKHNNNISNLRMVTRSENMKAVHQRKRNKLNEGKA